MILTVIAFIVMLGITITIHEFGHFAMAKLLKIRVLGFPSVLVPGWLDSPAEEPNTASVPSRWAATSKWQARHSGKMEPWGVYHMTNAGETSWHGFAQAIQALDEFDETCAPAHLLPIPSSDYPTPAKRPLNSRLNNDRLERTFGLWLQGWRAALALCLEASNP